MNSYSPHAPRPEEAGRRTFLKWVTNGLGAAFAATLGVPALAYVLDPRNRPAPPGEFKPVARLADLKEGVPFVAEIREVRRDAWALHPNDVVGRVWLIRKGNNVQVFNATCPHLGCSVNFEGDRFVCPCHNGTFTIDGFKTDAGAGRTNPAPRDLDSLEFKVEPDPDNPKEQIVLVKFQRFEPNTEEKIVKG